jgi:hypothetical protein
MTSKLWIVDSPVLVMICDHEKLMGDVVSMI